jgi:uncharacterized protein YdaU (DUF1376 family)
MHYYQFHISDYRKDTQHLSLLEHAIYRALLDTYYLEESPLCADDAKLMRTHSIRSANEVEAYKNVISDFFESSDGFYRHSKCDEQLAKLYEKSEKARQSAKKRWEKKAKAMRTHSEGNANGMLPNNPITQYPIPNNPEKKKASPSVKPEVERLFEYWKVVMTKPKAKLTPKRAKAIGDRLKQGYSPDDISKAIEGCASSEYHQGKNDNSTVYNDIELICRSGEKIEAFTEYLNKPIFDNRSQGSSNGQRKSLSERTLDEASRLQALVESGHFDQPFVGENDAALPKQMDVDRGVCFDQDTSRSGSDESEFCLVVQQDGIFNT